MRERHPERTSPGNPTGPPPSCSASLPLQQLTHAVVDKVGDVSLLSRVHRVHVLYVVQVKQVGGALPVVHVAPPLRLIGGDDLKQSRQA